MGMAKNEARQGQLRLCSNPALAAGHRLTQQTPRITQKAMTKVLMVIAA